MYKFALIGCGSVSKKHAEAINKIGKLIAVCDIVEEKANALAKLFNAKAYYDVDDLLKNEKEIDVVTVCTPVGCHAEHSIKSLQAGNHVLCESPLCLTKAGAWQTIETEKYCHRKLFLANNTVVVNKLIELKSAIKANRLGNIKNFQLNCKVNINDKNYGEWKGKIFPGGGLLYTELSKYIDVIIFLFGEVEKVEGSSEKSLTDKMLEIERSGTATLHFENKTTGTINWAITDGMEETNFVIKNETDTTNLNEIVVALNAEKEYAEIYDQLNKALDKQDHTLMNLFEGMKTVEAIEKIYKAVL